MGRFKAATNSLNSRLSSSHWHSSRGIALRSALSDGPTFAVDDFAQRDRYLLRGGVGYTSTGSFTSRFTQRVGLSPRLLRQRAHAFEPLPCEPTSSCPPQRNALVGQISAPTSFRGTIYVGLFTSPIPQGAPVRCTKLSSPGLYLLNGIADGTYYLRAAAFPIASDLQASLLPGEKMFFGNNAGPLIVRHGYVSGDPNLILHPPHLTDPPLVMGLPLL